MTSQSTQVAAPFYGNSSQIPSKEWQAIEGESSAGSASSLDAMPPRHYRERPRLSFAGNPDNHLGIGG